MKLILSVTILLFAAGLYSFISKGKSGNTTAIAGTEIGIKFYEKGWNNALKEAKAKKKLIFLDAYASWCGPCKLLKKKTFTDENAGKFFNENFINVALDMEKGEGPDIGAKYGVNAFPTLIIADADGKMITYTQGYITPEQLIEFGQYGLTKSK